MRNFQLIGQNIDVVPLHHAIVRQPELWNTETFRTTYKHTPHADVDDIWLRYSSQERLDPKDTKAVQNDHGAVWYPAAQKLPEAKSIILDLMRYLEAYELGRVVITRIPPGGRILPHADVQGDYVHTEGGARYHIVVQGFPGSMFRCGGEEVCMQTGTIWWFDHKQVHEIVNNSAHDRIHLLADCRKWPC